MRRAIVKFGLWTAATLATGAALAQDPGTRSRMANQGVGADRGGQGQAVARPQVDPAKAREMEELRQKKARRMEELLQEWAKRSRGARTLAVKFERTDSFVVLKMTKKYDGQAKFKHDDRRGDLAYLDFYEIMDSGKRVFDQRIVCTEEHVVQILGKDKNEVVVFPLAKQADKKALEEGPLPFLFNMDVQAAKKRYQMTLEKETETSYLVSIIPLLLQDQEEFIKAQILLNKTTFRPDAIRLTSPNNKDYKTFVFKADQFNEANIPDGFFDTRAMIAELSKAKWKIIFQAGGQNRPAPGGDGARPAAVGARPGQAPPRGGNAPGGMRRN